MEIQTQRFLRLIQEMQEGLAAEQQGDNSTAIRIYEKILDASRASFYPEGIALTALQIGMLIRPNDPYRALHLYAESLQAAEQADINMDENIANALHNMGTAYLQLKQPDQAEYYLRESISLRRRLKQEHGVADALNNLMISLMEQEKWNDAYQYGLEASKLHKKFNDNIGLARVGIYLGAICEQQGRLREAMRYYEQTSRLLSTLHSSEATALEVALDELLTRAREKVAQKPKKARSLIGSLFSWLGRSQDDKVQQYQSPSNNLGKVQDPPSISQASNSQSAVTSSENEDPLTRALEKLGIMPELRKSLETFNQGTCAYCGNYLREGGPRDLAGEEYLRKMGLSRVPMRVSSDSEEWYEIQLNICPYCGKHTGIGFGPPIQEGSLEPTITNGIADQSLPSVPSDAVGYSKDIDLEAGSKCIISKNILSIVQDLCTPQQEEGISLYALWCLSILTESLMLFDKIVVYDYYPSVVGFDQQGRPTMRLDKVKPMKGPLIDVLEAARCLEFVDPYSGVPVEDQFKFMQDVATRFRLKNGSIEIPGIAFCPKEMLTKNEDQLRDLDMDKVKDSLSTLDAVSYPDNFASQERERFFRQYVCNKIWQLETGRRVRDSANANHLVVQPTWRPFWQQERHAVLTAFHARPSQGGLDELIHCLGTGSLMDFPSHLALVLDQMAFAEELPHAILETRNKLTYLRETSRQYEKALRGALTHYDVADALQQWRTNAGVAIKESSVVENGPGIELFGWDLMKVGALDGMFIATDHMLSSTQQDLVLLCGLVLTGQFDRHFTGSAKSNRRLRQLFGNEL